MTKMKKQIRGLFEDRGLTLDVISFNTLGNIVIKVLYSNGQSLGRFEVPIQTWQEEADVVLGVQEYLINKYPETFKE